MAFTKTENIKIAGISACVPKHIVENSKSTLFKDVADLKKYISVIGVERRHVVEEGECASDLCLASAEKLIEDLHWEKSEIECLIFVSQTPDYIFPATACILQEKLGLSQNCMSFDITLSCPGWIYGMSVISSIINNGFIKKGLLLVGETSTKAKSPYDTVNLLAGDAGTATAIEYLPNYSPIYFSLHTDGKGFDKLIIPDGGYRNPVTKASFEYKMCKDGILRNGLQANMIGDSIFSFAVSIAPKTLNNLFEYFDIDKDSVDYFVIHQANQLINMLIEKRMRVDHSKFVNNIKNYGNTSSTSIPLAMICQLGQKMQNKKYAVCGFGTGLSWASACFDLKDVVCSNLLIYNK